MINISLKKGCFLSVLISIGFFVSAQKQVTVKVYPSTFDKLIYTVANNAGSVTPVDSGGSAYWDLSSFGTTTDSVSYEYLKVPAADKTTYPTATVLVKRFAFQYETKFYYNMNETSGDVSLVGLERSVANEKQSYTSDRSVIQYPLVLKKAKQKSFSYTYTGFGGSGTKTGTNKTTVPGFGRLKMPDKTVYDSVYLVINAWSITETGKNPEKGESLEWYSWKYKGALAKANLNYVYNSQTKKFMPTMPSVSFQKKPLAAPQPSSVNRLAKTNASIFPNPAKDVLNIQPASSTIRSARVTDYSGKEVLRETNHSELTELSITSLISGVYFIELTDIDGNLSQQKFVKQ